MTCDFCTFCYKGDADKLHASGQLELQVKSNNFDFNNVFVVYQFCGSWNYPDFDLPFNVKKLDILEADMYSLLMNFGINKDQYSSSTDKKHHWEFHVINHLRGIKNVTSEYVVFADADCWMNPHNGSWVETGMNILESHSEIFLISPNDGEPERKTQRMSQQMFLVRSNDFRYADFNQPKWDGNVHIEGGPMPEYWAMLEGRMELYCRVTNKYRYVLGPEFRYWHYQW